MNGPLTIKKHGVIIHKGSPRVTRTNEREFIKSLKPSPEELAVIREHNKQRDEIAKKRKAQLKKNRKLAAEEEIAKQRRSQLKNDRKLAAKAEIAKQRRSQLKKNRKLAAKELKSDKFQKRLASPSNPRDTSERAFEGVAEALGFTTLTLCSKGRLRDNAAQRP